MLTGLRIHDVFQNRLNSRDFRARVVNVSNTMIILKDQEDRIYFLGDQNQEDGPYGIILEEITLTSFGFSRGDLVSMVFGNLRIKDQLLDLKKAYRYKIPMTLVRSSVV